MEVLTPAGVTADPVLTQCCPVDRAGQTLQFFPRETGQSELASWRGSRASFAGKNRPSPITRITAIRCQCTGSVASMRRGTIWPEGTLDPYRGFVPPKKAWAMLRTPHIRRGGTRSQPLTLSIPVNVEAPIRPQAFTQLLNALG
jgi:hypothetical protein